ncbi:hypothetical protein Rrhod_2100 [Rhodococcus rhodnii LMG 5362]|uniref:Uncharacterized protein n=1 Tax=Rhodococcus rhodnii LMG 5362 TaxID=1273125 RepID=R7WMP6_9NOCA|nr:hypothetical protein Rrhod_2100 [Rhodococcus rhodnii LMG 5362]
MIHFTFRVERVTISIRNSHVEVLVTFGNSKEMS